MHTSLAVANAARGAVCSGCCVACVRGVLDRQGLLECSERFLDGSFAAAKKGGIQHSAKPSVSFGAC